jgi:RES domain-containing protein
MRPGPTLPKRLPLTRVRAGTRWMRIHAQSRTALWFGPARGRPPIHRIDDPDGRFRVCYFGTTTDVCFAETFLRNPPVRILALDDLAARRLAIVEVRRDLRLVPVHGSSLARHGATAELTSAGAYAASQLWSRALWEHNDQLDGILYRSRHDDSAICVALYDRAKEALATVRDDSLAADPQELARLLRRYGVGLTN